MTKPKFILPLFMALAAIVAALLILLLSFIPADRPMAPGSPDDSVPVMTETTSADSSEAS